MIDTGADRDIISEQLIKKLDIETNVTILRVVTVDNEMCSERRLASFSFESIDGEYCATVNDALVGRILTGENDVPAPRRDMSGAENHLNISVNVGEVDIVKVRATR